MKPSCLTFKTSIKVGGINYHNSAIWVLLKIESQLTGEFGRATGSKGQVQRQKNITVERKAGSCQQSNR